MKKLLFTLAICIMLLALALTLAACDTDTDAGATTTTSGTEDGSSTTTTTTAAQSLKRTYTIDGNLIATQTVPNGDTTTPHPAVPAKAHYDGVWELLSADGSNEYYYAKYTPTKYTVTFVADGVTVDTQTYTVENKSIVEPAVPDAPYGYYYKGSGGFWEDYMLDGGHKTVNASYTLQAQAKYALNGSTYYVSGYNYIIDGMIEILSEYKGKPVRRIGEEAFSGCTSLSSITIPSSVTSIGSSAFSYCTSLNGVYISDIDAWCNISFGALSANPLYYAKNLYLNGKLVTDIVITSVGKYAFYNCTSLESVTFDENSQLTSIDFETFYGCTSLKSITIPSSVRSIGYEAFYNCSSLESVTFGENSQLTNIDNSAFYYCRSLESITIPSSVTRIGSEAFYHCTSLKSVTFGNNSQLQSIGSKVFYSCSSLTSITIPSRATLPSLHPQNNCCTL
ncbi:MAG: leucine-rich repeat domain-containing protein [Clostridia bacterium]|nr:leucine-rich repeat domain-containing protein [Clostridia bacterium]